MQRHLANSWPTCLKNKTIIKTYLLKDPHQIFERADLKLVPGQAVRTDEIGQKEEWKLTWALRQALERSGQEASCRRMSHQGHPQMDRSPVLSPERVRLHRYNGSLGAGSQHVTTAL